VVVVGGSGSGGTWPTCDESGYSPLVRVQHCLVGWRSCWLCLLVGCPAKLAMPAALSVRQGAALRAVGGGQSVATATTSHVRSERAAKEASGKQDDASVRPRVIRGNHTIKRARAIMRFYVCSFMHMNVSVSERVWAGPVRGDVQACTTQRIGIHGGDIGWPHGCEIYRLVAIGTTCRGFERGLASLLVASTYLTGVLYKVRTGNAHTCVLNGAEVQAIFEYAAQQHHIMPAHPYRDVRGVHTAHGISQ
jgi:hypothetical protein